MAFAGAPSTEGGTGRGAVAPAPAAPGPASRGRAARSVRLDESAWNCPWPAAAESAEIDEETVVLKVTVDEDGRAEAAAVIRDPGFGFGPAAVACALRTRFVPARDDRGRQVKAESPPIRVRFVRG